MRTATTPARMTAVNATGTGISGSMRMRIAPEGMTTFTTREHLARFVGGNRIGERLRSQLLRRHEAETWEFLDHLRNGLADLYPGELLTDASVATMTETDMAEGVPLHVEQVGF